MFELCGMNARQPTMLKLKQDETSNIEKIQKNFQNDRRVGFKSVFSIHQPPSDNERLSALYKSSNLPETEPPGHTFLYNLRQYQKQALHWMLSREASTSLHPLWEGYEFPGTVKSNKLFYFNPHTGKMINELSIKSSS